ncbi:alpha/beta fold hydrolase [Dinoroseobacter sp. S375]|uniref:alpha/beta fold hydrolase n=1 Tax=Dinoroseobacter sp. S375 TaxID=3415136 RepID=UPI003C7DFCE5
MTRNRQVLVMLHGGAMSSRSLHPIAERLPQYRCLTPDLRGHGANRGQVFSSLACCAEDIATRLEGEDAPVHLFGLSLGGYVAMTLLAQHRIPIRSAVISGVVLRALRHPRAMEAAVQLVYPLLGVRALRRVAGRLAGISDPGALSDPQGQGWATPATVRDLARAVLRADPAQLMAAQSVRSLYLAGSQEPAAVVKGLSGVAAQSTHARAGIIPDAGHGWCLNDPDLAARILAAWISAQPLPSDVTLLHSKQVNQRGIP